MSHITIIISKSSSEEEVSETTETQYSYVIPIPHGTTPQQVGEIVRKAYKRLEDADD